VEIRPEAMEHDRLAALRSYEVLDSPPELTFDRVTALAAQHFQVPVSTVSLVDDRRIWFKARHGLDVVEVPREPGLCSSCILSDAAYVVTDAAEDARSKANALVRGEPGIRFYAAAPLVNHEGHRLGTLNIVDFRPRELDGEGEAVLKTMAGVIMDQMELRRTARQSIQSLSQMLRDGASGAQMKELLTVCAWSQRIRIEDEWLTFEEFLVKKLGLSLTHGISPEAAQAFRAGLRSGS
jgi:GAF domain-containing protein